MARSSASSGVGGELDPAGLAAAAGQHLRLDDDLAAELLGRLPRLGGRRRQPPVAETGMPMAREELLALVLVEVHGGGEPTSGVCEHHCMRLARCRQLFVARRSSPQAAAPEDDGPMPAPVGAAAERPRSAGRRAYAAGARALVFGVASFAVTPRRLAGRRLGREPLRHRLRRRGSPVKTRRQLRFGLMLFPTGDLASSSGSTSAGELPAVRRAETYRAGAAGVLEPRETWRGHDLGARRAGRRAVGADRLRRPSSRRRAARRRPDRVVWITDHAYQLEEVAAEPA